MKTIITLLCAATITIGGAVQQARVHDVESDPEHMKAIRAANDELMSLYNAGDFAGVAAMYEDDAILLGPGGYRVAGREAIDEYWAPNPDRPTPTDLDWNLDVHTVEGDDTLLIQRGTSRLARTRAGERQVSVVDFYVIWRQQEDGGYRIAVDAYWQPDAPSE